MQAKKEEAMKEQMVQDKKARENLLYYWDVPVPPEVKKKVASFNSYRLLVFHSSIFVWRTPFFL